MDANQVSVLCMCIKIGCFCCYGDALTILAKLVIVAIISYSNSGLVFAVCLCCTPCIPSFIQWLPLLPGDRVNSAFLFPDDNVFVTSVNI